MSIGPYGFTAAGIGTISNTILRISKMESNKKSSPTGQPSRLACARKLPGDTTCRGHNQSYKHSGKSLALGPCNVVLPRLCWRPMEILSCRAPYALPDDLVVFRFPQYSSCKLPFACLRTREILHSVFRSRPLVSWVRSLTTMAYTSLHLS